MALRAPGCRSLAVIPGMGRSEPYFRLFNHVPDDGLEVTTGLLIDAQLPVGAGAMLENPADVVDLVAAAQLVDDVVDELEVFEDEFALGHLALAAEVDELAVDAVAGGAPLVLHDQRPAV